MFRPVSIYQRSDFLRAVKQERMRRGITGEVMDDVVGLTRGHAVKIENGDKPWGRVAFNFTASMAWVLEALGLRLVLMSAADAEKFVGGEERAQEDVYEPRSGQPAPIASSTMVIYEWTPATSSPQSA